MKRGDVFRHVHPGGGGWGDPLERDPAAVLQDVRNEFLSPAKALADYGVVIDTRRLDGRCGRDRAPRARTCARAAAGPRCPRCNGTIPQLLRRAAE